MMELSQEENLTTDGLSLNPWAKDSDGTHIPFLSQTYKTKDNIQRSISRRQIGDKIQHLRDTRNMAVGFSEQQEQEKRIQQQQQQIQQLQQAQIIKSLMGAFGNSIAGHKFSSQDAKLKAAQFTAGQGIKPTANGYQDSNGIRAYAADLYNILFAQNPAWFI